MNSIKSLFQSLKGAVLLSAGTAVGQAIAIAFMLVLARFYTPQEFGSLNLFISVASVLAIVATFRYEQAILNAKNNSEAYELTRLVLKIAFAFSLLMSFFFFLGGPIISRFLNNNQLLNYWPLASLSVFFIAAYNTLFQWGNRQKSYPILAVSKASQFLITGAFQLTAAFFSVNPTAGLLTGRISGELTAFLNLSRIKSSTDKNTYSTRDLLTKYKQYPIDLLLPNLGAVAYMKLPYFVLAAQYSSAAVGFFTYASQIIEIPISLIGKSIGSVFRQRATELYQQQQPIHNQYAKSVLVASLVGVVPFGILFLFAEPLVEFLFGSGWTQAGHFASILAVGSFFGFVAAPVAEFALVLEKTRFLTYTQFLRLALNLAALFFIVQFNSSVEVYLWLIVGIRTIYYLLQIGYGWFWVQPKKLYQH